MGPYRIRWLEHSESKNDAGKMGSKEDTNPNLRD